MPNQNKKTNLQSLYPTALTHQEVYQKNLERRQRLPVLPHLAKTKVALSFGFIFFLLTLLILNIEYLWLMSLPGISASFLIMVGIGAGGTFASTYAARIFEMRAVSVGGFLSLCALYAIVLLVIYQFGWPAAMSAPVAVLIMSSIFCALSLLTISIALRERS